MRPRNASTIKPSAERGGRGRANPGGSSLFTFRSRDRSPARICGERVKAADGTGLGMTKAIPHRVKTDFNAGLRRGQKAVEAGRTSRPVGKHLLEYET